jgi:hypothetical protein
VWLSGDAQSERERGHHRYKLITGPATGAFEKGNLTDLAFAPTEKDREEHAALQEQMTGEMRRFSEGLLKEYRGIAEQLADLKAAINQYIYRPIQRTDIDQE